MDQTEEVFRKDEKKKDNRMHVIWKHNKEYSQRKENSRVGKWGRKKNWEERQAMTKYM